MESLTRCLSTDTLGQLASAHSEPVDILVTCINSDRICPLPLNGHCYPVNLNRIEASPPMGVTHPIVQAMFGEPGFFLFPCHQVGGSNPEAQTVTTIPGRPWFANQVNFAGSSHQWSDIVLLRALANNNSVDTLDDWRTDHGGSSWFDYEHLFGQEEEGPFITVPSVSSLTVLHELVHSVALGVPTCKCRPSCNTMQSC